VNSALDDRKARPVGTGSVRVPEHFAGMSYHSIPPPASVVCRLMRNWDTGAVAGLIGGGPGKFNWPVLDSFAQNAVGKQIVFTLGYPPDHLYRRAPAGRWPYPSCAHGNMVPDDLPAWATLVMAIANRLKTHWGRTGVIWELWNEVDVPAMFNDVMALLGPYTRVTARAIAAVDPTAIILSPSYAHDDPNLANGSEFLLWANAPDGAGGTAKQWVQGLALHSYEGSGFSPQNLVTHWRNMESAARIAGLSLPIYITESGYLMVDPTQARDVQRDMVLHAALGAQCFVGYSYDNGQWGLSGIAAQWNVAAAALSGGATIDSCEIAGGKVLVSIDGRQFEF
jgi:hypothetical protein